MDGWMGVGVGMGVWGCPIHAHMQRHACMHMHVKHAKHGCLHVGGHLQFLYMYKCVCVHVCVCVCMHVYVCGDTPMPPDAPHPPAPLPRATGSPKHQNSISPEVIEII